MALQDTKAKKLYVVGNYRFTGKLLGKGNFARVEEAIHTVLNVKVAIKIMDINQIKEDYVIKNLCREAKLMAKLSHPCICTLYQTMQRSDNVYYLVTELASGGDLCSFVKEQRGGRLEERPVRIYTRQFASALAHMHHAGVVHRDLKMENVMLNSAQTQIKIVDFGLSNFYNPNEPLKTHCGSPEYAAPELFITGMKYGPEVDLWSLGIILYGMVVGELPFISNRTEQVTSQERRKKLVAQINKGLGTVHRRSLAIFSPDLRNLIGKMLMPVISKRITIKELLFHPFVTDKGTKFIRTNPVKRLDVKHQAEVISQICDLTHQPSEQIIRAVKQEPFSRIGGMFNILAHKMALSRLTGDGISRVPPCIDVECRTKEELKKPYSLRNVFEGKGDGTAVQDKKVLRPRPESRRRPSSPVARPKTMQGKLNYSDLRMMFLSSRKPCSAGMTPKTCSRPATETSPVSTQVTSTQHVIKRLCYTRNSKNVTTKNGVGEDDGQKEQKRSKSEKLPNNNYVTRLNGAAAEGMFRKSLGTTVSDSKATSGRPLTSTMESSRKPLAKLLKIARPATSGAMENTAMAYGDMAQQKIYKKPTIYDPIARSIAGYVCNNVPNKLPSLNNFKK